jgi:hypothetical protein
MGGLPGGGFPHVGFPGGGLPRGPLAGVPHGGPGRIAAGNFSNGLRGVSRGARFSGGNTFNNGSSYSGSYSGSDYDRSGRYGYYGAAAAGAYGAAAGYAYGDQSSAYSDQTYTYGDQSCYRTVRYQTRSGWHTRVAYVCE